MVSVHILLNHFRGWGGWVWGGVRAMIILITQGGMGVQNWAKVDHVIRNMYQMLTNQYVNIHIVSGGLWRIEEDAEPIFIFK